MVGRVVTPASWQTLIAAAGENAAEYIGGGVAAAMVIFGIVFGIRVGVRVLRTVAADRAAQDDYEVSLMVGMYDGGDA